MARYIDADALGIGKADRNAFEIPQYADGWNSAIEIIANAPTADVAPKSEEGAECPTCHGTGRIGTTDWLTKNISKKQLAEEKARAIDEHEQYIKAEVAREIFEEIEKTLNRKIARSKPQFERLKNRDKEDFLSRWGYENMGYFKGIIFTCEDFQDIITELKKKYTEDNND